VARWLLLATIGIGWGIALELPVPKPGEIPAGELIVTNKFIIGKSLHVGVYAALAVLAAWVPLDTRYRWLMMFLLIGHAWGTEMLQEALADWCHRGGSLSDIGIDLIGISIGTGVSWKWWTRAGPSTAS
jgi:hypothetical protein